MSNSNQEFKVVCGENEYTLDDMLNKNHANIDHGLFAKVKSFLQVWTNHDSFISQQTSGSTGEPKTIQLLKKHMIASASSTIEKLSLNSNDKILLAINPEYIGGKMMIVRALIGNMRLVLGNVSSYPLANNTIKIDFFSFVPLQLKQLLSANDNNSELLNNAKAIILGGAPVNEGLHQLIKEKLSSKVYSTYGMTETVSHIALKLLNTANESPYFEALAGVTFSVDEKSCLVIHASHITGIDRLLTNDVVKLVDHKTFEWLGRYDFIINSGGVKIHAEQLEKAIHQLLLKQNLAYKVLVFALPDEDLGQKVALLIEGELEIENISTLLKALPKYHIPKNIYYISTFVYTASDKVDRKASIAAALQ